MWRSHTFKGGGDISRCGASTLFEGVCAHHGVVLAHFLRG